LFLQGRRVAGKASKKPVIPAKQAVQKTASPERPTKGNMEYFGQRLNGSKCEYISLKAK
jgi:hypothetical protein